MLNYKLFDKNQEMSEKFGKYAKAYGIIFMLLGLVGIFFPGLMSLTTVFFLGWLLIFSGIFAAMHTWQLNKSDWLGWLKTLILLVAGALIVIHPLPGILALGIIFAAYFALDAAANFTLAFKIRPDKTWWIALLNGLLSLGIAIFFALAIGNPVQTVWLVGLLVGISLFFDGIMLLSFSGTLDKKQN